VSHFTPNRPTFPQEWYMQFNVTHLAFAMFDESMFFVISALHCGAVQTAKGVF